MPDRRLRLDARRAEPDRFLQPDVEIAWANGRFELRRQGVDVSHKLWPAEALALLLLAQEGREEPVAEALAPLGPLFSASLAHVLTRFSSYLGNGQQRIFNPSAWGERLQEARPVNRKREEAPASITWMVTLECNRRCPYCFYRILPVDDGPPGQPSDSTLGTAEALSVISEMGKIGVADLYFTGGEPLLRGDLPDLIAAASARGIRAHVVTKYAITAELASRLVGARLHDLTISLDDIREDVTRRLTGAVGYAGQALRSIEHCLAAGLDVEVNAVVTRLNADGLRELATRLAQIGVSKLSISAMQPPYFRNANVGRLETAAAVDGIIDDLKGLLGTQMAISRGGAAPADQAGSPRFAPDLVCEVGIRSLDLLPNGDVTRCHYLPHRPDLVLGSIKRASILEIWRSAGLAQFVDPPREAYLETSCDSCGGFASCNARGRCVASAILEHGRPFAPDAFCQRVA